MTAADRQQLMREIEETTGIPRARLARMLDLSPAALREWVGGGRNPSDSSLALVALNLDVLARRITVLAQRARDLRGTNTPPG